MRVVFDTNIFISAFVIPHSQAAKALLKVVEDGDTLILSKEIIDEVLSVLARKFSRNKEAISHTALYLSQLGELVTPSTKLNILKDEPDNRVLECAISGGADIIVTGDKEMLKLKVFERTNLLTLKEYLKMHGLFSDQP